MEVKPLHLPLSLPPWATAEAVPCLLGKQYLAAQSSHYILVPNLKQQLESQEMVPLLPSMVATFPYLS